jgi:hypothetical protein
MKTITPPSPAVLLSLSSSAPLLLITATVNGGKLYICKAQAGDKRWFKGARKFVESAATLSVLLE